MFNVLQQCILSVIPMKQLLAFYLWKHRRIPTLPYECFMVNREQHDGSDVGIRRCYESKCFCFQNQKKKKLKTVKQDPSLKAV